MQAFHCGGFPWVAQAVLPHKVWVARALGCQDFSSFGSLALEHRLSSCGTKAFSCSMACGIFWTRDQTCIPHIGRRILNHWTTREVPRTVILRNKNTKLKPRGCEINSVDLPSNRKDQNVLCKFLFHVYTHIYAFTYVYLLGCDGNFIFYS